MLSDNILKIVVISSIFLVSIVSALSTSVSTGYLSGDDERTYSYFPPIQMGLKALLIKFGGWGEFTGNVSLSYLHNSNQSEDNGIHSSFSNIRMRALFIDFGLGMGFNINEWLKTDIYGGVTRSFLRYEGMVNYSTESSTHLNEDREFFVEDNSLGFCLGGGVNLGIGDNIYLSIPVRYHFIPFNAIECVEYTVVSSFWQYYGVGVEYFF